MTTKNTNSVSLASNAIALKMGMKKQTVRKYQYESDSDEDDEMAEMVNTTKLPPRARSNISMQRIPSKETSNKQSGELASNKIALMMMSRKASKTSKPIVNETRDAVSDSEADTEESVTKGGSDDGENLQNVKSIGKSELVDKCKDERDIDDRNSELVDSADNNVHKESDLENKHTLEEIENNDVVYEEYEEHILVSEDDEEGEETYLEFPDGSIIYEGTNRTQSSDEFHGRDSNSYCADEEGVEIRESVEKLKTNSWHRTNASEFSKIRSASSSVSLISPTSVAEPKRAQNVHTTKDASRNPSTIEKEPKISSESKQGNFETLETDNTNGKKKKDVIEIIGNPDNPDLNMIFDEEEDESEERSGSFSASEEGSGTFLTDDDESATTTSSCEDDTLLAEAEAKRNLNNEEPVLQERERDDDTDVSSVSSTSTYTEISRGRDIKTATSNTSKISKAGALKKKIQTVVNRGLKRNTEKKKKNKEKEKKPIATAKFKNGQAYNMKETRLKFSKKKTIQKKTGPAYRMQTIKITGNNDYEYDEDTKIMRLSKLTPNGYIQAEFPTNDPLNTPLHIACLTHYPEAFILKHLLNNDDDAPFIENSEGELPLHYAARDPAGVKPAVFEGLISANSAAVKHANIDESLPIHIACQAGGPSLYVIKRLVQLFPASIMLQNDYRVDLSNEELEDENEVERDACSPMNFGNLFSINWFKPEVEVKRNYESGWSPLHLAAINGAPPEVIETLLEVKPSCMSIETNQGRTAIECAKWVVVNALLNNAPVVAFQKTFAAIQIMQSYEKEIVAKELLLVKSSLVKDAMDSIESYGGLLSIAAEIIPNSKEELKSLKKEVKLTASASDDIDEGFDSDDEDEELLLEKGLTPLHRAVIQKLPPEKIALMIKERPETLEVRDINERTPADLAKINIVHALMNGDSVSTLTNTIAALELMQALQGQKEEDEELDFDYMNSSAITRSAMKKKTNHSIGVNTITDRYAFTQRFAKLSGRTYLGPMLLEDNDSAIQPQGFLPPPNLKHVNLRINIPAGFRRVRWALLHYKSKYFSDLFLRTKMKYLNVQVGYWNKYPKYVGSPNLKDSIKFSDLIGAERDVEFFAPKSEFGLDHAVSETTKILAYNDYCVTLQSVISTPDVRYGKLFQIIQQITVVDKGVQNCRIVCSVETKFPSGRPEFAWLIKNAVRSRATDYFYELADSLCDYSGS